MHNNETWVPDICLYHFPCDDGFAAAWVVRSKWPDVTLCPTNYGMPFPDVDIAGKNVLIVDFSYKPDVLADMAKKAKTIIILDHHKSAAEDLMDVNQVAHFNHAHAFHYFDSGQGHNTTNNVVAEFDMQKSGAGLAWKFCFPRDPVPTLICHIEDRDLWRMDLENTRAISLMIRSYPYDFDTWTGLVEQCSDSSMNGRRVRFINEARAIERFYDRQIADLVPTATLKTIGKWHGVPVAHAPGSFASDVAHELLNAHPDAPFAAVVVDAHGGHTYSLRSEDSRQDVSEVARTFGGGGHRNAAGFRMPG